MTNVLNQIVDDKRHELIERKASLPLAQFKSALVPSTKSMYDALAQANAKYIFECKKASPSKGLIRPTFDLDEILAVYTEHAAAISVLTDEKYFQGTYAYLEYVTSRVTQPVLNKDFFVDTYQVYLARYYNADAVLLMLSVLDDDEYRALHDVADELQLDVLTEVSNEEEAHRAVKLGAKIIGINNRNLRDLSTDLGATEVLVPLIRDLGHTGILISESGIYTHADVTRLAPLVDGFLVGSSLMAEADLSAAANRLIYGEVKICGVTSVAQASMLADTPAQYLGLIFAQKSKRHVTLEVANQIVSQVQHRYVGVFVDEPIESLVASVSELGLVAVQLHGSENQDYINQLHNAFMTRGVVCDIWLALGVQTQLPNLLGYQHVDKILLDCQVGNDKGGTGQHFDWQLLSQYQGDIPLIIAGGLTPDNAKRAQTTSANASMIDVNSGVESAPGEKDENKVNALFDALRIY